MANEKDTPKDGSAALQQEQIEAAKTGGPPREEDATVVKESGEIPTSAGPPVDELVTVDKDVVAEFTPKNAKRPSHILLFHAGQVVRRSELERRTAQFKQDTAATS
jgi:hypothetical protein